MSLLPSNVPDVRRFVDFQLLLAFAEQELDRAEVLLVELEVACELAAGEGLEVRPVCDWFEASSAQTAAIEGEDVALKTGEAGHCGWWRGSRLDGRSCLMIVSWNVK